MLSLRQCKSFPTISFGAVRSLQAVNPVSWNDLSERFRFRFGSLVLIQNIAYGTTKVFPLGIKRLWSIEIRTAVRHGVVKRLRQLEMHWNCHALWFTWHHRYHERTRFVWSVVNFINIAWLACKQNSVTGRCWLSKYEVFIPVHFRSFSLDSSLRIGRLSFTTAQYFVRSSWWSGMEWCGFPRFENKNSKRRQIG